MAYLLGLDIGTTATKGILLHPTKGIIAEAELPCTLLSPVVGWAEEDPDQWWSNVAGVTKACLAHANLNASEISAVGVSGMVPTLILLNGHGEVLYPSIQQNDTRAVEEIADFKVNIPESKILQKTGSAVTQQSIGPKFLWLRRHHPEIMDQTVHVMGSYDYIVYKLTGALSTERNWALESGLFDLHREDWAADLLDMSTITSDMLGKVHWPADVVGTVTKTAADHTGLTAGTPVVAGSADHIASAFSAGLSEPGDMLVKLGGSGDILFSLDTPIIDPRLYLDYHVIPGKFFLNGCMAASGSIIQWFRNQFAPNIPYEVLDTGASAVPPGSDDLIVLPYFLGEKTPLNDPLARGVFFGLTLSHTRAHIYRAILEGIAYGFKHHLTILGELGLSPSRTRVTNGGARSMLWKQITADVLNLPLEQIRHHPGSSLGAAFIAGKGIGVFKDWTEIDNFVQIAATIEPNPSAQRTYSSLFDIYRELYNRNQDLFPRLIPNNP